MRVSGLVVKDLTKDSIAGHILAMAAPVAISMFAQIAYQLIDLYFVARIGVEATAGVNASGNIMLAVTALTQVLGVGTVALVAHAVGRKDLGDANLVFNQAILLSVVLGAITMVLLYTVTRLYLRLVAADVGTIDAGVTFILWVLPGYALMLPMAVFGSALRGTGIVQPTIVFYMLTVMVNALLAPILIAGWGTGAALGVKGAGLATSISVAIGSILLAIYFHYSQQCMSIVPELARPRFKQWRRILTIGLPAGCEVVLVFLYVAIVYYAIRSFGAAAQAGFGIGMRVLQTVLLPGISVALAAGPIAGQNFGAKNGERVRDAFQKTALIATATMIVTTVLLQVQPKAFVSIFGADAAATAVAILFLQLVSWTLVAHGLAYTCSSMFQGLGNATPSLISFGIRFVAFAIPVIRLSEQPEFHIEQVWYLWNASVMLHAIVSLWLLHIEFKRKLVVVVQ